MISGVLSLLIETQLSLVCKLNSHGLDQREFYASIKRYPVQNMVVASTGINKEISLSTFDIQGKGEKDKFVGELSVHASGNDIFRSEKTFLRPELRIMKEDFFEDYSNEYSIDFSSKDKLRLFSSQTKLTNDSEFFRFYDMLIKNKMNIANKELLKRYGESGEDFEEEREYLIKAKEVYEEHYNY